jgi:DNA-binding transcriptional regulator YdaS (Cro superfamily)
MDLLTYFKRSGVGPVGFAKRVGVSYESIRKYGLGEIVPRAKIAEKIRRLTGGQVRADDFLRVHVAWQRKKKAAERSAAE